MKVLHVYKTYLPDNIEGVPRVIYEIAEGVRPLGIESEVLSLSPLPEPRSVAVGSHVSSRARQDLMLASTGLSLSVFGRFRELAATADIIHYHFPWPMMDLLHLWVPSGKPAVVTYHSDVVRQRFLGSLYAPLMHRFLGSVDRLVATSPNYLGSSAVLQRYRDKVDVIPIGIGERKAAPPALVNSWRQRLGEGFFLFVGALRYYKGLPFLLEAARQTQLPVVIAGDGDGAGEIARAGLPQVTALGRIDDEDKEALLTLCRALVLPSHRRSEAFGIVLLEAARAERPMISCEIGTGTSFANRHGETGLVVAPADAAALAAAMLRLANAPDEARRMGRAARSRYEAEFTAVAMAGRYAKLYAGLAGNHRPPDRSGGL